MLSSEELSVEVVSGPTVKGLIGPGPNVAPSTAVGSPISTVQGEDRSEGIGASVPDGCVQMTPPSSLCAGTIWIDPGDTGTVRPLRRAKASLFRRSQRAVSA